MPTNPTPREPVLWFANQMEARLQKHELTITHNNWRNWGWTEREAFERRLRNQVKHLEIAVCADDQDDIIAQSVDLACFAMMIADLARLRTQAPKPELIIEDDDGEIG